MASVYFVFMTRMRRLQMTLFFRVVVAGGGREILKIHPPQPPAF